MTTINTLKMAAKGTPLHTLIGTRIQVETYDHGRQNGTIESIAHNLYPVVRLDMGGTYRAGSVVKAL